jgi:hypothetical protein
MNTSHAALAASPGNYTPRHSLIAAFNDPALAATAVAALHDAGFSGSATAISSGPDFLTSWRDAPGNQGFLARLAAVFPSEEHEALEDYVAEASRGASLVAVHLDGHEEVIRARDVLRPLGAFDMRYFGNLTITDL